MQKAVKILALLCALVMLVSLAACGGDKKDNSTKKSDDNTATEAAEPESNLTDFEWVKFEMPEGYADKKESDSYVTIGEEENSKHIIKLFLNTLISGKTVEEVVKSEAEKSDTYTLDSAVEIGGRTWYPIRFTFNDNPSVKLYTDAGDGYLCYLTIYEMEENEPAVQTVLKSIEFDTSTRE